MTSAITIGIPFLDPGIHLRFAIQSVFAQSFDDWTLILLDDGSTDESLAFARSIKDPRVRVLSDGQRRGLNIRLNQIAQMAESPYLARMDADDIMRPDRLEQQYRSLIQHSQSTVLGSAAYSIDNDSRILGYKPTQIDQQRGFRAQYSFLHPTVMAATTWFRENPYSKEPIFFRAQDTELWCRTTGKSQFVNLRDPLLYYREPSSFSFKRYFCAKSSGIAALNIHFNNPRLPYMWQLTKELTKVWIAGFCDTFGSASWMISKRFRKLGPQELSLAQSTLDKVKQQALPI